MIKIAIALILASLFIPAAESATTFTASVTNANGSLTTKLTWSSPGATGCIASGHTLWSGAKPASGTLDLPAINLSGSYNLAIDCAIPGDNKATLAWDPVTQNTDSTALTNLAKYKLYRSNVQMTLGSQTPIEVGPTVTSYIYSNLPSNSTYWFMVVATNANGIDSAASNIVSKSIDGITSEKQSVTLTVNPIPKAPTATIT